MGLFDRYEVLRLLGRGGAGDVHLARDRLAFGREVALKTIRARVDHVLRAAFEREFATLASLRVPGVAQVYDFGVIPGQGDQPEQPFFTRAYVDGEPLDIAGAQLDWRARLALFLRAAAVVGPLHRIGVVHGDIKPGNIIIDANAGAWVIDFGLARARQANQAPDVHGTLGTPSFMAPELLRGGSPSVAADIYALGVTLWLTMTGEYPYAELGARAVPAKLDGKAVSIPSGAAPHVRAVLEIAARALDPDPHKRFPVVEELHASLTRLLPSSEVPAPPFVLPRPRGHAEPLAAVESYLAAHRGRTVALVVQAPSGGGKSLFLHELKWRMQLASQLVLEVFAGRSAGALPLIALFEQLAVVLGPDHDATRGAQSVLDAMRSGRVVEADAVAALSGLLHAVAAETALVLLVDDLDQADAMFGAVMRSAIYADATHAVTLLATARDAEAKAVVELQPELVHVLPRLSDEDSAALCVEALGPLDQTVVTGLVEHAQGLPGALASALYELSTLSAVTPNDVQKLPPPEAARALTHARIAHVPAAGRQLLNTLALVSALPESALPLLLGGPTVPADAHARLLAQLEAAGLLARDGHRVLLADNALRKGLRSVLGDVGQRQLAAAISTAAWAEQLSIADRASLAVIAHDVERVRALVPTAVDALAQVGAHALAAELLVALLECAEGEAREIALMRLASTRHVLGQDELAASLAQELADAHASSPARRADARVLAARALTALGRFDHAAAELGRVGDDVEPSCRALVQRELAKIQLRRGDYAAVSSAVELGLAAAPSGQVRIELLCSQGIVASYRGDQAAARVCYEEALKLARAAGERGDEANVLTYLAIGCQRAGDMTGARDLLAQSLEIARELGDVGNMARFSMNLGAVLYYLGEPAAAAEHYDSAARLARRAGRTATRTQALANLAHVHVYFGLYEQARGEIDAVLVQSQAAGQRVIVAQATAMLADLLSRTGDVERALIHYDDAISRYTALSRTREVVEHNLDAAETLLNRGGPADASAAAAYVARAREHLVREQIEDLMLRLDLLVARVRLANGDAESAAKRFEEVVARARTMRDREVEWAALAALAHAQEQTGSLFVARRSAHTAVEVLEAIALRVTRDHRDAFWQDPRRRAVREHANQSEHLGVPVGRSDQDTGDFDRDQERERLFQIIRRLASEHDLERLLERIIESAVDLSGAERGSVLLVDADGHLMPQITHSRSALRDQAHELFSRSIAEAVLIDGEPIVTVDAVADGRLQSYVSVHKLALRSVACLPIRGHSGTLGVLYLEHRRSRGRFSEATVDLLCAFADQAAIALENARQLGEIQRQKAELEEANRELTQAKGQLEDLLLTRTRQLDDVQEQLARAIRQSPQTATRHGIVGNNAGMQRLFAGIARLATNKVPVVICGETGTGKELVARAIHYSGPRANEPFITIDCGSLPDSLLESELFGYVKGAFSGADRDRRGLIAAASGGTLFLDEVAEMPPKMQAAMLRVLQERKICRVGGEVEEPVDVRLLAATRVPLQELVTRGVFREDLLYRLSVVELVTPALRDRREDIPALCEHFLRDFATREAIPRCHLTRAALAVLMDQPWPGNVRQLSHVLLQAAVMSDSSTIDADDLSLGESVHSASSDRVSTGIHELPAVENIDHHKLDEKQRILQALEAAGWSRVKAAQSLGMPRRTFYRRLADYSII